MKHGKTEQKLGAPAKPAGNTAVHEARAYDALLERLPGAEGVFKRDGDGYAVSLSPACAALLGETRETACAALAADPYCYIEQEDRARVQEAFAGIAGSDGGRLETTMRLRKSGGESCHVKVLADAFGGAVYVSTTDVTDSVRMTLRLSEEKERIQESDERYRIALASTSLAVWDYDIKKKRIRQSPHALRLHGFGSEIAGVPETLLTSGYVHPSEAEALRELYRKLDEGAPRAEGVFRVHTPGREGWWYEHIRYTSRPSADGTPYMAVGMSEDVTERYEQQKDFAREMQLQQVLAADVYASVLIDATEWRILRTQCRNPLMKRQLDENPYETVMQAAVDAVADDENAKNLFERLKARSLDPLYGREQNSVTLEYLRIMPDRLARWVREDVHLLTDPESGHLMLFVWVKDIDDEKRRLDELSLAAETDSMTGLLDHDATIRHIKRYLNTEGGAGRHALFMIDIDNFKEVNDRLGHLSGDEAIERIALAIHSQFRSSDILGRIGGDEFLVLMKNAGSGGMAQRRAAELVDALQFLCSGEEGTVEVSASVGVNLYAGDGTSFDVLYAGADAALYEAKNAGKNRYAVFSGALEKAGEPFSGADSSGMLQLRTLLEHMDGGVIVAEAADGRIAITYASPSFFRTLHRSAEEAGRGGELAFSLVYADDRPELMHRLNETAETGEVLDITYRVTLSGGGIGWRHLRAARLPSDGGACKLIGVVTDATQLKRTAMLYEAIVENTPCGIGMFAYDGKTLRSVFCNRNMLLMNGVDPASRAAGGPALDAFDLVHPDDRERVRAVAEQAIQSRTASEVTYQSTSSVDGEPVVMRARGIRIYEEGGDPVLLVMNTDVTRETKMERELRFAEERYRVAMAQSNIILWEVDIRTRTFRQSLETAKRFGHSTTEFPNMPESIIATGGVYPDSVPEMRRMYTDLFAGRDSGIYFNRAYLDGDFVWLKVRFRILHDETGAPYYAVGISEPVPNIDAQMRRFDHEGCIAEILENELVASGRVNLSQNRVEQLEVHGDARYEPMPATYNALYALSSMLIANDADRAAFCACMSAQALFRMFRENRSTMLADYQRRMPDGAERGASFLVNLIRHPISGDLYLFFGVRDTDMQQRWERAMNAPIVRDPVSLLFAESSTEALVRAALSDAHAHGRQCAVTVLELSGLTQIRAEKGAAVASELMHTIGRLFRTLSGRDGFVGILSATRLLMVHAGVPTGDQYMMRLTQMRERVAAALKKLHPNDKLELVLGYALEKDGGTGYETLLHRASLACRNAAHWADHPVARYAVPEEIDTLPPAPSESAQETGGRVILLAEPAPEYRRQLREIFAGSYRVLEAKSGEEALRLMRGRADVAAMVLELDMPEKDGFEVLSAMRRDEALRAIPVIAVSADDHAESEMRALDLGAADVVKRPLYGQIMLLRVRNLIERGDAARMAEQNRAYELRFQQQANLLRMANYDEVTGIFNKRAFCARVREVLDANPGVRYVLVRWDIDRFKVFNDAFGTQAGDRLLREIGAFMHGIAVREMSYAHLEADHFVLLLSKEQADIPALLRAIEACFAAQPIAFSFMPRLGVYEIDEPGIDVSLMCDRALLALRSVKNSYSNRIGYYSQSLRSRLLEEQALIGGMQDAIRREEFSLYFQPQYNYATGALIGAEALVRWNHPARGVLLPAKFIPLFEDNGFITALDRYVWERSCRVMRHWLDQAHRLVPVSVAVNISRLDIYDPHLCETLGELIKRYDLPPSYLKLEITESAYMENPEQLIEVVRRLRGMGFTVEMDDFGSGYSSLNTLKDVPVNVLKLDIKFLTHSEDASRGGSILSSIIRMARWLQLPVIAEGVETKQQADYLKSLGCTLMQGYYFARPMTADDFERLLERERLGEMTAYRQDDLEGAAAFWDASAQTALIFNTFVGGAAIMEYRDGQLEALRINDAFFDVIGTTRGAYADAQKHVLDRFTDETRPAYVAMLEEAIRTGGEAACEAQSKPHDAHEKPFWTRTRAKLLAKSDESYMLYIAVENITARKELEQRARLLNYSEALLSVYDEIFEFDFAARQINVRASYCFGQPLGRTMQMDDALARWFAYCALPEDAERLAALVTPQTKSGSGIEYRFRAPDGREGWISATWVRVEDDVFLLCNEDTTARKHAERSAEEMPPRGQE